MLMNGNSNERLRDIYGSMAETAAPAPWRRIQIHVGGITAVGFAPGTELLLVLSHDGLGVVDVTTGVVIARGAESRGDADDPYPICTTGIGPLAGQRIALTGLWGGGMRTTASDGWSVCRIAPHWPAECAVLSAPGAPELDDPAKVTMLAKDLEPTIRAIGFSDSGRSLVVATTQLLLWYR
jgi:hypothetical protein